MGAHQKAFYQRFPPSEPCTCETCRGFCARPGWWLVAEARAAIDAGLADRMMLELSQDRTSGVLSPAFQGNEGFYALAELAGNLCTFLAQDRCELFGSLYQPLECRFCHHDRLGTGLGCHREILRDWDSGKGRRLVRHWLALRGLEPLPRLRV